MRRDFIGARHGFCSSRIERWCSPAVASARKCGAGRQLWLAAGQALNAEWDNRGGTAFPLIPAPQLQARRNVPYRTRHGDAGLNADPYVPGCLHADRPLASIGAE